VFLNIAGGIKVADPAIDLAIISSILSSNLDIPLGKKICFAGEAGLSGEIRPVSGIEQRIREAAKMGFENIVISRFQKIPDVKNMKINITGTGKVEQLVKYLFA
ncbi:MAG TPA: magnesium chelatase domain-containing protein, partial [Bacteroidales bacterium]|nr:magnesium chelatase domain-containing protein [Bacteroidales bacterium]